MSVREYLAASLTDGCAAEPVFAWADEQGKSKTTVLVQAGKLGFYLNRDRMVFVYDAQRSSRPAVPRAKPARAEVQPPGGEPEDMPVRRRRQPENPDYERRRGKAVRAGHDYVRGQPCEHTLDEWLELIGAAVRSHMVAGDVLLFRSTPNGHKLAYEIHSY